MGHASSHATDSVSASRIARGLSFGFAVATLCLLATAGCSSTDDAAPPAGKPRDVVTCPALLSDTNGASCKVEGQLCSPSFTCPAAMQTAQCRCTGGKFACSDAVDVIAVGAQPQCVSSGQPAPAACPATVVAANGAKCTQTWRTCTYNGAKCPIPDPTGRPQVDVCYCRASEAGLAFYCEPAPCSPPLPPIVVPPVDAGSDASHASDASQRD